MTKERIFLHPLPVRIWHWIHAIGIVLLVLTGIQLHVPGVISVFGSFKTAVAIHNFCGFLVLGDYCLWLGYYVITGKLIKLYVPPKTDITKGLPQQAAFYLYKYFKGEEPPFQPCADEKFNSLQKCAYCFIMFVLVPLQIATGVMLYNIRFFKPVMDVFGGVQVVDAVHLITSYCFVSFLFVHLYLCTLGHTFWAHFKAMIFGYEEVHTPG